MPSNQYDTFAREFNVTITSKYVGLEGDMYSWRVTLAHRGQTFSSPYSMGLGHADVFDHVHLGNVRASSLAKNRQCPVYEPRQGRFEVPHAPQLQDVLESLQLDARSVLNAHSFEDFCYELGYDTDSREAERIYEACKDTAFQLRRLFGGDVFEQFLKLDEVE